MAYKKSVQGRSYPHMYNVTMTVGSRKSFSTVMVYPNDAHWGSSGYKQSSYTSSFEPNKRDDVMLVQYLLKRVYQNGHAVQPPLCRDSGAAVLKIDGLHGPKTQRAIEQFQLEMCRNGRSIATDGCVDPEKGDGGTSSISQTGYTITWLNKYLWVLCPYLAADIRMDPECPAELKAALMGDGSV